ncbi:MAG: hypothetical protein IGR92_16920 [Leptolyngbyaceae cyanobacterium T60_A2020_046]|nr:hypothetical protein [Leptolyngbyaceae cyanobacterium T60_A2020_046]
MGNLIGTCVAIAVCVSGLASLQVPRLRTQTEPETLSPERIRTEEQLQAAQLKVFETLPVLGFDNMVANWVFLSFLQYFGNEEARLATDYDLSPSFFEVIVRRDPYFMQPYLYLSASVSLFAAQPERTVALLERGLEHMTPTFPPNSFLLWRYKSLDELLFLGDAQAARRSLEKTAEWAEQSPWPDAANFVDSSRKTAAFLAQDPDSRQAQVSSWLVVWGNAVNDNARAIAQERIESLGFTLVETPEGSITVVETAPPTGPSAPDADASEGAEPSDS